jgi:hypothetical protein
MRKPASKPFLRTLPERIAFDRMRDGGGLVQMLVKTSEKQWFVVPRGPVTDSTAATIREWPDVKGQHDGLFPYHDQTWRMIQDTVAA